MANQNYFIKGYCEGWDCVGHCIEDGEETHIVRKPSGDELQLCGSCLIDYRKDYPAPNNRVHVDAAIQPPAEVDSSPDIIPANVAGSQPRQ